jgi:trimeric autotransporter adhesin
MKKALFSLLLVTFAFTAKSQLVMTNGVAATTLVSNLIGPGVTATNITYTGSANSKATFTCGGACNIGFPAGIALSTGSASAFGAAASSFLSTDNGTPGDAQLSAIIAPNASQDAAVLEFDFTLASDSVKFEFIFASEEYNDYVNTIWNDVFAFYISGPGIVGSQNMAIVPGTAIPISIGTVNNGGPFGGVSTGPCTNCAYFVDNVTGGSFAFDGHTVPLMAKAKVQPCQLYHMKIAIADGSDHILDSGVLLKQGSFSAIGPVTVTANGAPIGNNGIYYACTGSNVTLCLTQNPTYNWSTGATTQCITINEQNINATGVYEAIFTGVNGCFGFSQVQVVFLSPTATITPSGPLNLCPGGNVTLSANPGNTYLWSNGATTQNINVTTAGTYTVTVSLGPNCSATSTPVSVTVGSASAQINGVLSLCNGANTTLTANLGQSYLWSNGAVTQAINVAAAGNYTVTVTQAGGCTATAVANVTVNAAPVPAITGTLSICQGTNTSLNAGPGFASYLWSNGNATQTSTVSTSGTYTVTVTNASGCSASTSASVTVNPLPVPAISGVTSFCSGNNSTLNAGAGYANYVWNTGALTQQLPVSTAGTYTVTVTDANNCTASANSIVTVNPLPIPNISGLFSICQGNNTTIDAGAGYTNYLWSTGTAGQTITVSTGSTYTVTVTDANGCSNNDSQLITVNANPVPAISGTLSICQGQNTTLSATPGYSGYLWSTGGALANTSVNATGAYTVTVTDVNGCTGTTSSNVTVNPLPVPSISGTLAFCSGGNSTLNAGAGYSTYLWSNGNATQTINVNASGNYTVTVSNPAGCSASTSTLVTVNALPAPSITGTLAFCQGSNTTLNATAGFATYQWSTGAGTPGITVSTSSTYTVTVTDANGCTGTTSQSTIVNPNPVPVMSGVNTICQGQNTSFTPGPGYTGYSWSTGVFTPSVNLTTAGTYTVTVSDANGCLGSASATLTVNPLPSPAITGTTTFCQGLNSNLNAGPGFNSYLWNTGANTQQLNVSTSGNYTVTVTNAFGCSSSVNTLVTVNPLPVPAIIGPAAICAGNNGTLNAGPGYAGYLWSNGLTTQTISTGSAGTYTVTVTSAAGCSATTSASMLVNPLPTPSITGVTTICQGDVTNLNAGAGYATYFWSTGANTQTINAGTAGPITVTVTDANGCSSPASTSITVNALPIPVISGQNAFCNGSSGVLDAGTGFTSYLWNTGANSRTITVSTAGTYTVTVTANTGCVGTDNDLVVVHPNPTPVITGNTSICQGANTTLNAGNGYSTYNWSNGATTQTIPVSTAGNFGVTVTSSFGCVGTTSTSTVVNALPTPSITGITAICQGTTTTFDAGAGYSGYLWSNGATTQTISPGTAGTYTVTVTDANACSNNTNLALIVNALPTPAISGTNAFCDGDNSNLSAGAGYINYVWSTGANTQMINVTAAGNYTVTVTDNNGCSANTNLLITVHPNPTPVILGGTGICFGTTTALSVPGSYSTYLWNTGATTSNITVGNAGNYNVTVTSAFGCVGGTSTVMVINALPTPAITGVTAICQGTITSFDAGSGYTNYVWSNGATTQTINPGVAGSYTVTVTDINGCQNNTNIALVVNALPTPAITGDFDFCLNQNSDINAGSGYVNYLWNNGAVSQTINVSTAGNYAVTVTDNNGCSATTNTLITVYALPTPAITGTNAICDGTTTTFAAGNYSSYAWSNGNTTSTITTGVAGTYNVTVTDIHGCTGSTSQLLTVYDLPSATISGSNAICIGQSTALDFNLIGTAPFVFTYSNGITTSIPINNTTGTATINVNPTNTTNYTMISIADAHCQGSVAGVASVVVNPLPQPLITGDLAICDGETTTLTANAGYTAYTWSNNANQPAISTGSSGIYTVTVVDINGCENTSPAVNLIVNSVPVVAFTNDTSLTCAVPKINFTNLSIYDAGSHFDWTFGDGTDANESNPSHLYYVPGNYPVSLTVTTPAGCVSSANQNVEILFYPLPVADFVTSPGVTNVFNGKVSFVDRSSYAVSWLWEFGDGASKSIEQNTSHYYNEIGDYKVTLTITNVAGCVDKHTEEVNINPFYIPNAFTPNGDGVNDVFYYAGYQLDVLSYEMNIFNRWGQLVFAGAGENESWKGETATGDEAPQGTYVYRIIVKTKGGQEHVFNGQVSLVR